MRKNRKHRRHGEETQESGLRVDQKDTLEVIAVDAPCRGQGVGTALVQAVHHLADKDGAPTYVEFAGEQLLSFYTKQGFGEHDASCDLEHGGSTITMYARVRNGNSSNGAAVVQGGSSAKVAPDTMARS